MVNPWRVRRFKRIFLITIPVLLLFLLISYVAYFEWQGNFHVITPGEAYRSAQLNRDRLVYYVKKYNIKSILNLRGDNPDAKWYKEEKKICGDNGIAFYSLELSPIKKPLEADIKNIAEILKSAPRPILIHCKRGADRTGFVAAMWKVIVDKEPKSEAKKQLSIKFFHFAVGQASIWDRFFLEEWNP